MVLRYLGNTLVLRNQIQMLISVFCLGKTNKIFSLVFPPAVSDSLIVLSLSFKK